MRSLIVLGIALLLTFAGCSAVPFGDPPPQEEPAPVKLVNNASQTETFTVGVVEEDANLTVHRRNGDVFNLSPGPGSGTHKTSTNNKMVKIEFPDSARIHGEYTLQPGEEKQIDIENVAPDEAIVVLVFDNEDGTYRSIKTLSCDGPIQGYRVTSQKGGPDDWTMSTHSCGFS